MVGVATKNRCDNCRKRKKKCDEKLPSCGQCMISGWTCPGYRTPWKFVDETNQLAKHYASRKYVYDIIDAESEARHRCGGSYGSDVDPLRPKEIPFHHRNRAFDTTSWQVYVPRYLEPNPLGASLVFCMGSKVEGTLIPLHLVGSFFDFLPARMGLNIALDHAVSCLCSIYSRQYATPYGYQRVIYESYSRALASLRTCLGDPHLRMESETLCASILLQLCELIVNVDRGEWSTLARGTHFLLESRGVERYKSPFELAMLESQLGYIFSHSVKARQPCFVSSPEWQALFPPNPVFPYQTLQPRSLTVRTQRWNVLFELYSVFLEFSSLSPSSPTCAPSISPSILKLQLDRLCITAEEIFATIKLWIEDSPNNSSPPTYPDVIAAVLDCTACMALLMITKMLSSLQRARSRSNSPESPSSTHGSEEVQNPETIAFWKNRAMTSFAFVQKESMVASKVLDFGMQQLTSAGEESA